ALLHLAAVGVEDAVDEVDPFVAGRRRLHHQDLVRADTEAPVGEPAPLLAGELQAPGGRVDHDEIVAGALHLGEGDALWLHRVDSCIMSWPRGSPRRPCFTPSPPAPPSWWC